MMSKWAHTPIEQVFPNVFKNNTGIFITEDIMHTTQGYAIDPFPPSQQTRNHFDSRNGAKIEYLIMHYSKSNFPRTIKTFTSNLPFDRVSAHYVVTEKETSVLGGQVIRVVQDTQRAWHAGFSAWQRDKNLNATSLGIEHVNTGFTIDPNTEEKIWCPFDEQQIQTSGTIGQNIVKEYDIPPTRVLGHADISPSRKQDPGILFPWGELYSTYNIGAWLDGNEMDPREIISKFDPKEPCPDEVNLSLLLKMLKSYGYNITQELTCNPDLNNTLVETVIRAFKSHFSANQQPELYNSSLSINDMYWAWALNAKYYPDTDVELVDVDV